MVHFDIPEPVLKSMKKQYEIEKELNEKSEDLSYKKIVNRGMPEERSKKIDMESLKIFCFDSDEGSTNNSTSDSEEEYESIDLNNELKQLPFIKSWLSNTEMD